MSRDPGQENKDGVDATLPRPGQRLHAARIDANLEVSKVAAQLHLTKATLLAVEADEFDLLPARVFVRGYYRNYARLVGLPEQDVLAELDEAWPGEGEDLSIRPVDRHIKPELRSSHHLVRLFTWLVILGLLSLLVIWWVGYLGPKGEMAPPPADVTPAEPVPGPGELTLPAAPAETVSPAPETVPGPSVATGTPVDSTEPAPPVPTPAAEQSADAQPPATLVEPAPAPASAAVAPVPKVSLRFRGDSWVDIRDSSRSFRLVGTMKAGQVRELGGEPPYTVLLGNSPAVEISINGKPFDQRRFTRGKVARFTLEVNEPSATQP